MYRQSFTSDMRLIQSKPNRDFPTKNAVSDRSDPMRVKSTYGKPLHSLFLPPIISESRRGDSFDLTI